MTDIDSSTDKLTIDLSMETIGKIDVLIEKGMYPDRFSFIESALQNQLAIHQSTFDDLEKKKSFAIGIVMYSASDLEKIVAENKKLDIKVIGRLTIADNVSLELANRAINKITLAGVLHAIKEILPLLQSRRYTLFGHSYQNNYKALKSKPSTDNERAET